MEDIVNQTSKIFKIEKPSGRILFEKFGELTDQQRISALLVGKYFARKAGLNIKDSLSISEISKEIGRPMTTLSGEINKLIGKGYIEKLPDRKYRVVYHRISEIIKKVLKEKK